ncbi:MAG TPA: hypothetical protein VD788_10160 [Candidatus Polarisedimenticolaceae bacterium]|nr:hypothetical protein [Candidatus Polarisedimenticolaceae bacterium]
MVTAAQRPAWSELDEPQRRELDLQYLRELSMVSRPGLTAAGIQAYLDYRHERPERAITTFEEGQIDRLLQRYVDRSHLPDPVALEEHRGRLERFGAARLHLTNAETYVAIMVTLNLLFVIALLVVLM